MKPEIFKDIIEETIKECGNDKEMCHSLTDAHMEALLKTLGYGEAIELINNTERWYA